MFLCHCIDALDTQKMETDKLHPAAGFLLRAASKYVSPPPPTVSFFRGNNYDVKEELEPVAKIMWIPCMETWRETTSEPVGEGSKDLWKAEWIYTRKMEKEA